MIAVVAASPDEAAAPVRALERGASRPLTLHTRANATVAAEWASKETWGRSIELTADGVRLSRAAGGGRPIFWAPLPGTSSFIAASHLQSVKSAIGRVEPDRGTLARTLLGQFDDTESTCLKGVRRLRAGETVELRPTRATAYRATTQGVAERTGAAAELVADLRGLLRAAVARAVQGHRKVAVAAGGGLDSSALLALALDISRSAGGPEVVAIALDFGGEGDDRPHLRALERALDVTPHRVHPSDFAKNIRRALVLDAAPMTYPTAAWDLGMLELAGESGATALLTGAGGDGLFDGDPECLGHLAWRGDVGAIREAAALRVPWSSSPRARVWEFVGRPIARSLAPEAVRRALRRWRRRRAAPDWLGPYALECLTAEPRERVKKVRTAAERFEHFAHSSGLLFMCDGLAQYESAAEIGLVSPFLDEALVAYIASVPPRLLLHGGRLRGLFREAIRGLIPESVRLREDKASFDTALVELLVASGGLRALEDLAEMRALDALGLVEAEKFMVAFRRAADRRIEDWAPLWAPLAMEAFAREYVAG